MKPVDRIEIAHQRAAKKDSLGCARNRWYLCRCDFGLTQRVGRGNSSAKRYDKGNTLHAIIPVGQRGVAVSQIGR